MRYSRLKRLVTKMIVLAVLVTGVQVPVYAEEIFDIDGVYEIEENVPEEIIETQDVNDDIVAEVEVSDAADVILDSSISAMDGIKIGNYTYDILSNENHTVKITKWDGEDTELTIPSSIKIDNTDYSIVEIGDYAFAYCDSITNLVIPDTVVTIGKGAFVLCKFSNIDLPNRLEKIGDEAFSSSGLVSITIPASVENIGEAPFRGCKKLNSISVESGNTKYDDGNGSDCIIEKSSKTLIEGLSVVPDGVEVIGKGAFRERNVTVLRFPESVKSISENAFYGCQKLTDVTLNDGLETIGGTAFVDCSTLTNLVMPDSVTSIGAGAFARDKKLKNFHLSSNITKIEGSTFASCESLTNMTIPEGVTYIDNYAFYECTGLTEIIIPGTVEKIGGENCYVFTKCRSLRSVSVNEGVKEIGGAAFSYCVNLTDVSLPSTLTKMTGSTFADCEKLENVSIPDGIKYIGNYIFSDCNSIKSVTIPASATEWCDFWMFGIYCNSLIEIVNKTSKPISLPSSSTLINYKWVDESGKEIWSIANGTARRIPKDSGKPGGPGNNPGNDPGSGPDDPRDPDNPTVYNIKLATKQKYTISDLAKTSSDGKDYVITYGSDDDKKIAALSNKGQIAAKKTGTSTITLVKSGTTYTINVKVFDPQFVYSDPKIKCFVINAGEKITPEYNSYNLPTEFSVDKNTIKKGLATINPITGEITAIAKGNVKVTATVGEGKEARRVTTTIRIYDPIIYVKTTTVMEQKKLALKVKNGISKPATQWSIIEGNEYATIDEKGKLTGVAPGKVVVQAINNNRVMTQEITVEENPNK